MRNAVLWISLFLGSSIQAAISTVAFWQPWNHIADISLTKYRNPVQRSLKEGQLPSLSQATASHQRLADYATDGVLDPTQSPGVDIIDQIHRLLLTKGRGRHYIKVPPGRYIINTQLYLGAQGLAGYVIDMTGATFVPGTSGLTPFLTDSPVKDIHLIGGQFLPSATGMRFTSCLSGYSDFSHPVNGLEISLEECAGTVAEGIAIYNPVVDSSAENCKNISIHNTYIHDNGRQNINISYCNNVEVGDNRLSNPALNGPMDTDGQAINAQVNASHANIHDNDISGTPFWIRTPASLNAPASGVYVWGQNITIAHNHIHDSKCTDALCDQHGRTSNIGVVDAGKPFPFGGTAANYGGVDGVHLDTVSEGVVADNTISGYSTGVTVEVSRHVDIRNNRITSSYRNALYDSSRYQETLINPLNSLSGLNAGSGVTLGISDRCRSTSRCVTATVSASVPTGTLLLSQRASDSAPFDASNLFPQIEMSSTADLEEGTLALVLSSTASCDQQSMYGRTAVAIPFPAILKGTSQLHEFSFDYERMYFLHLGSRKQTEGKFLSWCLITTARMPQQQIAFTVSGFRFALASEFNRWEGNQIAGTGQFAALVSGCGRETTFRNNTFTDVASGDYAYNSYGWLLTAFVGNKNCRRDALVFDNNTASPSKRIDLRLASPDALTAHVSAVALGGTGSRLDQPFGSVEFRNNVIVTGSGNIAPKFTDSGDPRGLRGIAPGIKESGTRVEHPH